MDRARLTAWTLTLAGLIPFVGCAALVLLTPEGARVWIEPLTVYGAIILSFLGGARWGRTMAGPEPDWLQLVLSNLPAVAAWLTFLPTVPDGFQLLVMIFGLIAMLYWDLRTAPVWYRNLRLTATGGAALSLLVVMQSV
ncbi:MAG: hypothetical protein B7Y86_12390 [Brevundimonas subvibrioides]|uniref:DUF3429 domain-containing protein n=1 Tax=Brevundimonas subvibrioides TaxID=74313 RepID=A0A258HGL1_9CAUL|nr:DUF3429 domain-containing protein [Brevundimonas subvibrioides]OYX55744.1 MAG: hypothetical protein B7Y86_12390 [Brevundimonas subvibrioides]